ncbi:MAG: hypothetical protein WDN46_17350 [Methylocella sp.]
MTDPVRTEARYHLSTLVLGDKALNHAGAKHCGMRDSEHTLLIERFDELRKYLTEIRRRQDARAAAAGNGGAEQ